MPCIRSAVPPIAPAPWLARRPQVSQRQARGWPTQLSAYALFDQAVLVSAHADKPTAAGRPLVSTSFDSAGKRAEQLQASIPPDWLAAAAHLPGKSLHVGIALWRAAGVQNARTVLLSNTAVHRFGLDRNAKYRALAWLEEAGLISVERQVGRSPVVTLLKIGGPGDER